MNHHKVITREAIKSFGKLYRDPRFVKTLTVEGNHYRSKTLCQHDQRANELMMSDILRHDPFQSSTYIQWED